MVSVSPRWLNKVTTQRLGRDVRAQRVQRPSAGRTRHVQGWPGGWRERHLAGWGEAGREEIGTARAAPPGRSAKREKDAVQAGILKYVFSVEWSVHVGKGGTREKAETWVQSCVHSPGRQRRRTPGWGRFRQQERVVPQLWRLEG